MNKLKMLTVAIAASLAGAAFAEDLVLTGAYPVTVASGATTTISDKITGTGPLVVLGGGTVALSNSGNDFTGGIIVSNGIVRADAAGSLGSGPISLEGDATLRQVRFNANNATFSNNITLKDKTTSRENPAIYALKSVTIAGTVAIDQDTPSVGSCYLFMQSGTSSDKTPKITINGDYNIGAGRSQLYAYGNMRFNGVISATNIYFGGASDVRGVVEVSNPSNVITSVQLFGVNVSCLDTNVLRDAYFQFSWGTWSASGGEYGVLVLNGHDQRFQYLQSSNNTLAPTVKDCAIKTGASQPATVMITGARRTGGTTGNAQIRISGPVSLLVSNVVDNVGLSQAIKSREHAGTGSIEACTNSQFRLTYGATAPNVTNIIVRSGGGFFATGVTNALSSNLKVIRIEGSGRFYSQKGCLEPVNCPNADLIMDEASFFYVGTGVTNTVDHLIIGGKEVKAGTYTYETLPQMRNATELANYAGTLIVRRHHRGMLVKFR